MFLLTLLHCSYHCLFGIALKSEDLKLPLRGKSQSKSHLFFFVHHLFMCTDFVNGKTLKNKTFKSLHMCCCPKTMTRLRFDSTFHIQDCVCLYKLSTALDSCQIISNCAPGKTVIISNSSKQKKSCIYLYN